MGGSALGSLEYWSSGLHEAFRSSYAVSRGGPGGFEVIVMGEKWHIGWSPGRIYFAANTRYEAQRPCRYHFDTDGILQKEEDSRPTAAVNSVDEVKWLLQLLAQADDAEWGEDISENVGPRPVVED